jgi:WS/DGAT/MGAT family acyltransferase
MRQLTGFDASFLALDSHRTPMHVTALAVYDQASAPGGKVTFKQILAHVDSRLERVPNFRQRVVTVPLGLDQPYWVDDPNFDLEFHVRHIALPKPGDWRQLCIQAARLHARPLDRSRPLWELYVIEGLGRVEGFPRGAFAILSKIHHAAFDGVSGTEDVHAALHDPEGVAAAAGASPTAWTPERQPNGLGLLTAAAAHRAWRPWHYSLLAARAVPVLGGGIATRVRRQGLARPRLGVPRTRFGGRVSAHRVADGRRFPLADLKRIKAAVPGATVNDVVLALVGGGMRRYLDAKGELPDKALVALAPVSVRSDRSAGEGGNQVVTMTVSLASDIDDPIARLDAVRAASQTSKERRDAVRAQWLMDFTRYMPSSLAGLGSRALPLLSDRASIVANAVVTNVPGPQVPLFMCGARMVAMHGLAPIVDGAGLIHVIFSYCGNVMLTFTACRDMLPDPAFYAQCLEDSFQELCKAVEA